MRSLLSSLPLSTFKNSVIPYGIPKTLFIISSRELRIEF